MRARLIAIALTTFALCATAVLPVAAQQRYRVTDLGTLGGDYSRAFAINYRGQVVGNSRPETPDPLNPPPLIPFVYDSGVMRALSIPPARGRLETAWDINNRGWVTGHGIPSSTCDVCRRAYIHDGRTTKFLPLLSARPGAQSEAFGINGAGHVTGVVAVDVPGEGTQYHAFIYNGKRVRDLGTLGGGRSIGYAINRWDWVAGESLPAGGDTTPHAFLYRNGVMRDLGTLDGTYSSARAINNKGWVTGESGSFTEAFIYDGRTMRGLGPKTGSGSAINSRGWVVGWGRGYGPAGHGPAFLYDGTAVRNLNDLLTGPNHGKWWLNWATGINDKGQIVGVGFPDKRNTDIRHAFLLTPVAETE